MEVASLLRHPGVAPVYAWGTDAEDRTYIVQRFIEGPSLLKVMSDDPRADPRSVLPVIAKIALALQAIHERGIVHRDLKPDNVILRRPTEPILIDFGIAYVPTKSDALPEDQIVGSLRYMSPEQAKAAKISGASDIYGLGVILYEWLAGERPVILPRSGLLDALRAIIDTVPPPIEEYRPGLPRELRDLIARMLHKKASKRPSPGEVAMGCGRIAQAVEQVDGRL